MNSKDPKKKYCSEEDGSMSEPPRDYSPTPLPRNLTTSALASQLFRGRPGGSSIRDTSFRRSSVSSDDLDSVSASDPGLVLVTPEELSEINNRMAKIQDQLEQQRGSDEKYVRLKQENAVMREKVNSLEEQMMLNDDKWRNELLEAEQKYKEFLSHTEREKSLEMDGLDLRCRLLEKEHEHCITEKEKLRNEANQWKVKCERLEDILGDLRRELEEMEEGRKTREHKLWNEKEDLEKRLRIALDTCEELRGDIDHLRKEQGSVDGTASELEEELHRLKEEQRRLREANEELHAELLNASLDQGRNVICNRGPSLADEMNRMTKDEALEALREQEIVNKKLRLYVDGILLRIMEMYPEILEIKASEDGLDLA